MSKLSYRHGMARIREYNIWHLMKDRCLNRHSRHFDNYGARGITVCDRWLDFANFIADMGPRPEGRYSLERIDNSQGYSPDNCRWGLIRDQVRNRRSNRNLTAFGKTQCVTDWAEEYGIKATTLFARLRTGVSIEDALRVPLDDRTGLFKAKHRR